MNIMEIQLHYLTDGKKDTIALTKGGVVVSAWTINGHNVTIDGFASAGNLNGWAVKDERGLEPIGSYGTTIARRTQAGILSPLYFVDEGLWKERRAYWENQAGN